MGFTHFSGIATEESVPLNACAPATITTAGAVTYTAAQLLNGLIFRDPNGASRSDVTPTAALIVAALEERRPGRTHAGTSFCCVIKNDADAAETITVTAGTGVTLKGTMTIAQNAQRLFHVYVTSNTAVLIMSVH
jgi:hypothetical protein